MDEYGNAGAGDEQWDGPSNECTAALWTIPTTTTIDATNAITADATNATSLNATNATPLDATNATTIDAAAAINAIVYANATSAAANATAVSAGTEPAVHGAESATQRRSRGGCKLCSRICFGRWSTNAGTTGWSRWGCRNGKRSFGTTGTF